MPTFKPETENPEAATRSVFPTKEEIATDYYMRRMQAGDYLKSHYGFCSATLLSKLATIGGGPIYSKMGRLNLYRKSDLDRWAQSRISAPVRSTSEIPSR
jgi:hypothetical protein